LQLHNLQKLQVLNLVGPVLSADFGQWAGLYQKLQFLQKLILSENPGGGGGGFYFNEEAKE